MCQELCDANDEIRFFKTRESYSLRLAKTVTIIMPLPSHFRGYDLFCNSCGRLHDMAEDSED